MSQNAFAGLRFASAAQWTEEEMQNIEKYLGQINSQAIIPAFDHISKLDPLWAVWAFYGEINLDTLKGTVLWEFGGSNPFQLL